MNGLRVRLARLLLDPRVALSVPLLVGAGAAVQQLLLTRFSPLPGGLTHYNNFLVFRQAFVHLVEGRNLYLDFPGEHFDNFLYSPTFAVLMAPFSVLPICARRSCSGTWRTRAVMVAGIRSLPGLDGRARGALRLVPPARARRRRAEHPDQPGHRRAPAPRLRLAERRRAWAAGAPPRARRLREDLPARGRTGLPRSTRSGSGSCSRPPPGWSALASCRSSSSPPRALALAVRQLVPPPHHEHPRDRARAVGGASSSSLVRHRAAARAAPRRGRARDAAAAPPPGALRPSSPFRTAFLGALLMWMIAFNHLTESPTFVIAMAGHRPLVLRAGDAPRPPALLWFGLPPRLGHLLRPRPGRLPEPVHRPVRAEGPAGGGDLGRGRGGAHASGGRGPARAPSA